MITGEHAYVFDDHDEERKLDAEDLVLVGGAGDEASRDVGPHDLEHGALDVLVGNALYVPVAHVPVPDLQRLRAATSPRAAYPIEYRIERKPDWYVFLNIYLCSYFI